MKPARHKRRSILPGFGLTMGFTMTYLSLIVLIPLAGLFLKSATLSRESLWNAITNENLLYSLKLTFGLALAAACINVVFGFITAWTLVRYPFPGRNIVDALIDMPFALPTAVSGITLATLWTREGWLGTPWTWLATRINAVLHSDFLPEQVSYSRMGMLLALVFIGVPFVVRTLQPALEDLDPEVEEAAASLGASRRQAFFKVVLPALMPAVLTGFALAFARAIGEYGSVIFISNNKPGESQIVSHLIAQKMGTQEYAEATTLGIVTLVISFLMLISVNGIQWWSTRRVRGGAA